MFRLRSALPACLLLAAAGVLCAQEGAAPPPAGTWKVVLPTLEQAEGRPVLLLKFEKDKEGKWAGKVLASRLFKEKGEVSKVTVTDKAAKFAVKADELSLTFDVNLGKDARATKLYGEAALRRNVIALEMERSNLSTLDNYEILREEILTEPLGMAAVVKARLLISDAEEKKAKPAEVRAWAEKAIKSAQMYGAMVLREELMNLSRALAQQKGFEAIALQYAQRAENGLDEKAEGPVATKRVLDLLAEVQEKAGKKDEAARTYARIKKLDFRIKPAKYAGRKAKGDRVVLAEVFTSAQAKTCVAAEMAMASLEKTFGPAELAVVAYHQHFPEGDPLGSPESEERLAHYGKNVPRLPVMILNGKVAVGGGGGPEDAQDRYDAYRESVASQLETESKAELKLTASRKGDKVTIDAQVGKLDETGDDIRLRVVLVETETAYKGGSGAAVHYNVVRAMPGGYEGTVMKEKAGKKTFTIDLAELRKKLEKYQADVNKKRPFPKGSEKPLELKKLRVIAFVQNDVNNEVLQAARAEIKGE